MIDVQSIGRSTCDEVLEYYVSQVAVASPRFDHEDLVSSVRVHIAIQDILNRGASAHRAYRAASGLVAPDLLDKDVRSRRLNSYTFVTVGDFDVVNPVIYTFDEVDEMRLCDRGKSIT